MSKDDTTFLTKHNIGRCVLAGAGFLADAYDLFVINIVKNVLDEVYGQTNADVSLITSTALWGAVAGQIFFGAFADYFGRRAIFITTLLLTTLGSLASAFCFKYEPFSLYHQLAICRFVLGFGVGGEYPLSATVTSESTKPAVKGNLMALVFSMQGIGNLLASALMYALLATGVDHDYVWRIGLGFGAVPGLLAFYFRWRMSETEDFKEVVSRRKHTTHWQTVKAALYVYRIPLIGTAVSWFLLDVFFYGNSLFAGTVTELMGLGSGPEDNALNSLYVALMALPGYYLSVGLINVVGRKQLQMGGFGMVAILYFVLAAAFKQLKGIKPLFLVLYGLTYLFSNFGPNATTYIIPGEYYVPTVRATCHGISAASGKVGAAVASYGFSYVKDAIGLDGVLMVCGGVGALGVLWTIIFIPRYSASDLPNILQQKSAEYAGLVAEERRPLNSAINTPPSLSDDFHAPSFDD